MFRKSPILPIVFLAVLSLASVLCQAQAQSALTRHVRQVVANGEAKLVGASRQPSPCTSTLFCRCAIRQAWKISCRNSTIPPAPPTGTSSRRRSLPRGSVPARKIMTPWSLSRERTALPSSAAPAMAWTCRSKVLWRAIETAFHVTMGVYQHPTENRTFYAPDREPTASLPFPLWHISGLDNYSIPHPMFVQEERLRQGPRHRSRAGRPHATTGSGPSASFLGSDMRAAYYGGTALTGAGQNLGLFEYYGTDLADLTTYFTNVGQTNNVPITLLSTDGTSTTACIRPQRATTPNRRST